MSRTLTSIATSVVLLCLIAGARPASAQPAEPEATHAYLQGGNPRQSLDVYRAVPSEAEADTHRPTIVFVHGGGWRAGEKQAGGHVAQAFTEAGLHFISVGYRLVPEVQWPENIEDVAAAIAWVYEHPDEFGVDPERVTLMGHSAGAHLVACAGADPRWLAAHGRSPDELHAVVLLDGAGYDIPAVMDGATGLRGRIYRLAFTEQPDVWADASPALNIPQAGPVCPTWLSIINDDRNASHQQSALLFEPLDATGLAGTEVLPVKKSHRDVFRQLGAPGDPEAQRVIDLATQAPGQ